jgi:hypothetical protein
VVHVEHIGDRKGAHRILVGKLGKNIPFRRPMRAQGNNIKMNLQKIGWEGTWTGLIWLMIGKSG